MAQLTDRQIEAHIEAAIKRQPNIDAVEPRAIDVTFYDGRFTIHFDVVDQRKLTFREVRVKLARLS